MPSRRASQSESATGFAWDGPARVQLAALSGTGCTYCTAAHFFLYPPGEEKKTAGTSVGFFFPLRSTGTLTWHFSISDTNHPTTSGSKMARTMQKGRRRRQRHKTSRRNDSSILIRTITEARRAGIYYINTRVIKKSILGNILYIKKIK